MEKLYSVKDVAEELEVSEAAVRKWIFEKKIGYRKIGKFVRITRADIDAFVKIYKTEDGNDNQE